MGNEELKNYIEQSRKAGMGDAQIGDALRGAGWSEPMISEAFGMFTEPVTSSAQQTGGGMGLQVLSMPPRTIGRFKASKLIAISSWNILKQDKEMLFFPVFAVLADIVILAIAGALYYFVFGGDFKALSSVGDSSSPKSDPFFTAVVLALYFLLFFIATFFQAGMVSIIRGRLYGQNLTFGDGMKNAARHIGKIFLWSLLSASVGVILQSIAERSKLLGRIIVWILGSLWSILSFFVVPVLIMEDISLFGSLKKSASVIKKTWGEIIILDVGVSFFFMVIGLLAALVFIATLFTANFLIILISGILLAIFFMLLLVISSVLDVIFKVVLYQFANTGTIPQGFSLELMRYAFKSKK
ncbi:MAG: DUF6159 family protein [bacterium]|nr:DUF6159 family protein [bacterium]